MKENIVRKPVQRVHNVLKAYDNTDPHWASVVDCGLIPSILYLGQLIVGFFGGWPGPIIPKLRDPNESPIPYRLTETELSLVATMTMLGSIPGPYASGWLSNSIGRKPCIIAGGVLSVIGSAILAAAENLAMLYCGRLLLGFAGGIISVMIVVYIGEIASTSIRGILLTGFGITMTVGSILLFSIGPYLSYFRTTSVGLALAIAFTFGAIMLPESPTFYIIKGYGIIPHTIIGEMFTPNVRSNGSTLSLSIAWVFGFTVNTVFGVLIESVGGHLAFWFFSSICACAFIFTIFYIPETKGKSLLEIQELLNK
ncbi:jg23625 [Pararge aegeria aegeria]|uniref:Jg23625 protein n=1 Tax=Pararge aegeria aegeria TaxID=348720 RepID=A0A8S4SFA8_9NEOP|nr:jg23625 [Pararge aegeria aegeria]